MFAVHNKFAERQVVLLKERFFFSKAECFPCIPTSSVYQMTIEVTGTRKQWQRENRCALWIYDRRRDEKCSVRGEAMQPRGNAVKENSSLINRQRYTVPKISKLAHLAIQAARKAPLYTGAFCALVD